jgi:hypothetical protein
MTMTQNNISCTAFQNQLPELIGAGENVSNHPHVQSCALCRALLSELETIAAAARDLFPIAEPPDGLWIKLQTAIESESPASYLN